MAQMRKYDTRFDWTKNLSDEKSIECLTTNIEKSKRIQSEAKEHDFTFIDTSFNRESVIEECINQLFKSGKLDITKESYDRYDRTL